MDKQELLSLLKEFHKTHYLYANHINNVFYRM